MYSWRDTLNGEFVNTKISVEGLFSLLIFVIIVLMKSLLSREGDRVSGGRSLRYF